MTRHSRPFAARLSVLEHWRRTGRFHGFRFNPAWHDVGGTETGGVTSSEAFMSSKSQKWSLAGGRRRPERCYAACFLHSPDRGRVETCDMRCFPAFHSDLCCERCSTVAHRCQQCAVTGSFKLRLHNRMIHDLMVVLRHLWAMTSSLAVIASTLKPQALVRSVLFISRCC